MSTDEHTIPAGPVNRRQQAHLSKIVGAVYELKHSYEQVAANAFREIERLASGVAPVRSLGSGQGSLRDMGDALGMRGRIESRIESAPMYGITAEQVEHAVRLGGTAAHQLDDAIVEWLHAEKFED